MKESILKFLKECRWIHVLILVIIVLFAFGTTHFIVVLNTLEKSAITPNWHNPEHIATLQVLQNKVFSGEVITYLITLITVLLVTLGVFCLNRFERAHERNKKEIKDLTRSFEEQKESFKAEMNDFNEEVKNSKTEYAKIQKIMQRQDNIHIPILSIYSSVKSLHMFFYGKKEMTIKDIEYLNTFCYYTERHIESIKDELSQIKRFDEKYQYLLVNTYMSELIEHLEELLGKFEEKGNKYAEQVLGELIGIRKKITDIPSGKVQ